MVGIWAWVHTKLRPPKTPIIQMACSNSRKTYHNRKINHQEEFHPNRILEINVQLGQHSWLKDCRN